MYSKFHEILTKMGISSYKLSKETGISQVTLTHWKNGTYTPKIDKLQKIADYLGVSVEYLCGTGTEKSPHNKLPIIKSIINHFPLLQDENITDYATSIHGWNCDFCFVLNDPSLKPERMEIGDRVYLSLQECVGEGSLAGVVVDGNVLIRRIYYCDNQTVVMGVDGAAPLVYSAEEMDKIKILGKVIGFTSKL